jgi:monovalent cation/hydrogen antiporter
MACIDRRFPDAIAATAIAERLKVPGRELIQFLTFVVILATLVVQGLNLPLLIRVLHIPEDRSMEREEREARLQANVAALQQLQRVAEREPAKADALQRLRVEYEDHIRQLEGANPEEAGTSLRRLPPLLLV